MIKTRTVPSGDQVDDQFPERLRERRLLFGFSKRDLAALTAGRVTERTLWNWESGQKKPRLDDGFRIVARLLGVTPGWLGWGMGEEGTLAGQDEAVEGGAGTGV